MNAIIRQARHTDLDILFRFEQGVIAAERPFDPTLKKDPIYYYDLPAMIDAPEVNLVVAESAEGLIGSGYARIEPAKPYLRHPLHAYLGFMYVDPAYRGKGVNQLIINDLKTWARSKGLTELRLDVYTTNDNAIRAYEKAGFTPYLINMRMGI